MSTALFIVNFVTTESIFVILRQKKKVSTLWFILTFHHLIRLSQEKVEIMLVFVFYKIELASANTTS